MAQFHVWCALAVGLVVQASGCEIVQVSPTSPSARQGRPRGADTAGGGDEQSTNRPHGTRRSPTRASTPDDAAAPVATEPPIACPSDMSRNPGPLTQVVQTSDSGGRKAIAPDNDKPLVKS